MSAWSDAETRELIALWPTNSAAQIGKRMHRPRSAVAAKVRRLREDGVMPRHVIKHLDLPVKVRRCRLSRETPRPAAAHDNAAPCTLLELTEARCHWPIGDLHQVAVLFCGGMAVTGSAVLRAALSDGARRIGELIEAQRRQAFHLTGGGRCFPGGVCHQRAHHFLRIYLEISPNRGRLPFPAR